MRELTDRSAVVTGGARGIGRAFTRRLTALGANVAVLDRNLAESGATPETIVADINAHGGEGLALECDVGNRSAVAEAVQAVEDNWGRVDVLVCNAGGGTGALDENPASDVADDELRHVLESNLLGTVNACVAVAPLMKRLGGGKIVTMSSQAGVAARASGTYAHYGAAKAGVAMYTRYLAQDLGPYGVNVNCLAPGRIATERMLPKFEHMGLPGLVEQLAIKRLGTPEDCANVLEFLCTQLSDYVTGAVIPVDGGAARHPV